MADQREQLRKKYLAAVEMVWRKPQNCPICDSTAWNLGDLVDARLRHPPSQSIEEISAGKAPSTQVYVFVPVTCLYCGYTMFFHSGVLDVRQAEEIKAVPPLHKPEDAE
jgi:hypothetical protein